MNAALFKYTPPSNDEWTAPGLDAATSAALRHEAMMDLAGKVTHGFYAYVMLCVVLWTTSDLPYRHFGVIWGFTFWFNGWNAFRAVLVARRESMYQSEPSLWRALLVISTLAVAAGMSTLLSTLAIWYGLADWTLLISLLYMIGITAGTLFTLAPWCGLMRAHNLIMVLPPALIAMFMFGQARGWSFGLGAGAYLTFLLIQGRSLHETYVALRIERAVARKRNEELDQARRAAEQASNAKSQFLANLSHEIRTPMNGIMGMARLALEARPEPAVAECIETLEGCATGLLQVLNDMLDFSKIEAGKMILEHVPFQPHAVVAAAVRGLAADAQLKGLALTTHLPPDSETLWVEGDPTRLRQVLLNLIGNAVKFTPSGGITISMAATCPSEASDLELEFSVADTGIGILPTDQNHIFEAFHQADGSVTRRFGGTGLGLAICARLVEAMHGWIRVDSTPGQGSCFTFHCRFRPVPPSLDLANLSQWTAASSHKIAPITPASQSISILVAEDNPVNQTLVTRLLVKRGHAVEVAANGLEAVAAAKRVRFDLILMDISMPELDGMEAARAVRLWQAGQGVEPTPIVALTANVLQADQDRFAAAGLDGFLGKPFHAEELYAVVEQNGRRLPSLATG